MKRKYSLLLVGTLLGLMKLWKILETRASSSGALNLVCHHLEDSLVKVDQQEVFQVLKVSNQEVFQEGNQGAFQVDNQEASLVDNQGAFQVDNQEASLEDNQEAFQEDNQEVFQGDSQDFFQVNSKEAIQVNGIHIRHAIQLKSFGKILLVKVDNLVRLEDNIQVARGAAFLPEAINLVYNGLNYYLCLIIEFFALQALDNILAVVAFILVAVVRAKSIYLYFKFHVSRSRKPCWIPSAARRRRPFPSIW
ncbi:Hypothetical predicted protein [Cloeon dipterum]|uniref:Transmembrane protein n=1 Tax=Cloeon dipterum TaxID=197152 RepID=A0A8S1D1S0_9INSE|nr:Hypothetical predicted protein [Cloeon dipterum]